MSGKPFVDWIEEQALYQRESYSTDVSGFTLEERLQFIDEMLKAAVLEIGEAYNEFSWKSWAKNTFLNRDALASECVDVLFFVANVLAALDVSSSELNDKYRSKMNINTARQIAGYDTSTGKCPSCKRALDDSAVTCTADRCSEEVA